MSLLMDTAVFLDRKAATPYLAFQVKGGLYTNAKTVVQGDKALS